VKKIAEELRARGIPPSKVKNYEEYVRHLIKANAPDMSSESAIDTAVSVYENMNNSDDFLKAVLARIESL